MFDEDKLITGDLSGGVHVVSVLSNQLISYLGPHSRDNSGFDSPVERLALSKDKRLVASVAQDPFVQLWDLKQLHGEDASSGATRSTKQKL